MNKLEGFLVWEVIFVEMPTVLAMEGGSTPKVIGGPVVVIAKSRDSAIAAAMQSTTFTCNPAHLEVLCRPFNG